MKSKNRSLSSMVLLGVLIIMSLCFLFIQDFYITKKSCIETWYPIGGLGISFEGDLQRTLTVKFTNLQDQSSFIIHCPGFLNYPIMGNRYLISFDDPLFMAMSKYLPHGSLCGPESHGGAAATIEYNNALARLIYSCTDQPDENMENNHRCIYNNAHNLYLIAFKTYYGYQPAEVMLTIYQPEETIITTITPDYYRETCLPETICRPYDCFYGWVNIYLPFPQPTSTVDVP
jgi:hypothetical protein